MRIENLELRHFRNLTAVQLAPEAATVVLRGGNGQGKTNLLEAAYLCATSHSFRRATSQAMLAFGAREGLALATTVREGVRHDVSVRLGPRQRALRVDGRPLRHVAQLLETVNVVAFFPDDLRIAKGGPEERRRFLDRAVANHDGLFVRAAYGYHRALKARNALLRAAEAPDRGVLAAYDAQLVAHGAAMQRGRGDLLAGLRSGVAGHFSSMLGPAAELGLHLTSGLGPEGAPEVVPGAYAEAFAAALRASGRRDRARGSTSVGPHRCDLVCLMNGRDMRTFASQGQQRAAILAFKLAEVASLVERLGSPPILLLDDVSSELDHERSRALFAQVAALECQVWVTTTGAVPLPLSGGADVYQVEAGQVRQERATRPRGVTL